ncbi:ubiquinone anaerobic biosynthesis accessory factor UbiT [Usitatibacter palustris]|uniref:Ubiquinone biosynthesis accessory factor UbiJ n=1 Tax=Usitatibacter palustris TaxID=2732487 RepID=A0A6M4H3W1_9PROT|nr:SCP2 sterol-binding domain-containing protein [Usitatibacter palustris]QJR14269.1 Ubiquinone biosynthesis accessory factor UbiJ [Usitatibacter palustris]
MRIASLALATALNAFLRRKLPAEVFDRLSGREVCIDVTRPAMRVSFLVRARHFVPMRPSGEPYLRFRASARDFAAIAAREEDADTLFFQRRLVVEGDTESGLLVKNALEALEAPRTRALLRRALRITGAPR